ncbi:uncharacterized protein AMSG_04660 [Thecamonas trahens ATCC 50062]|uniref:Uncharacterized protein n=1 Tax=Thecamonas trahens ATCC 50062 TaxID=461836 RepID=A0A0L0D9J6_THETB|nr:hypothetical protein AMSG_04660 [Thecamonas trahens ATCC 50062]KNC48915.1 hypothetical protein AMSG_04660 [Thecamonas trahens ATCC 50062]|eukprot:XP_013758332.1 hypothetical protein AMSG_04660 [Thecamonas trahens ATCC 50062]
MLGALLRSRRRAVVLVLLGMLVGYAAVIAWVDTTHYNRCHAAHLVAPRRTDDLDPRSLTTSASTHLPPKPVVDPLPLATAEPWSPVIGAAAAARQRAAADAQCGAKGLQVAGSDVLGILPSVVHTYCTGHVAASDAAQITPLASKLAHLVSPLGEMIVATGSVISDLDATLFAATIDSLRCAGVIDTAAVLVLGPIRDSDITTLRAAHPDANLVHYPGDDNAHPGAARFAALAELLRAGISVFHVGPTAMLIRDPLANGGVVRDADVEGITAGWETSTRYGYGPWSDDPTMGWGRFCMNMRLFDLSPQLIYLRATLPTLSLLDRVAATLAADASAALTSPPDDIAKPTPVAPLPGASDSVAATLHLESYYFNALALPRHHGAFLFPQPKIRILEPPSFVTSLDFFTMADRAKASIHRRGIALALLHHEPTDANAKVPLRLASLSAYFCTNVPQATSVFATFPREQVPAGIHKDHSARAFVDWPNEPDLD